MEPINTALCGTFEVPVIERRNELGGTHVDMRHRKNKWVSEYDQHRLRYDKTCRTTIQDAGSALMGSVSSLQGRREAVKSVGF